MHRRRAATNAASSVTEGDRDKRGLLGWEVVWERSVDGRLDVGARRLQAAPSDADAFPNRGFNLFSAADLTLFTALARGEWQISGFRNRSLRRVLPHYTGPQLSRLLTRLHVHGLIRTIGHTYKYYLTQAGQRVVLTALKLRALVVIPALAGVLPAAA